jgi:hypothetical protein
MLLKNQKLMTKATTILCIEKSFENRMPFLTNRLHQVRKDKCKRSTGQKHLLTA